MKPLDRLLYQTDHLTLRFDLPLDVAVKRLQMKVDSAILPWTASGAMFGTVSRDHVRIQRVHPRIQNSFKPVFIGAFSEADDATQLIGVVRLNRFIQLYITFWLGLVSLSLILFSVAAMLNPSQSWFIPFIAVLMVVSGAALIYLSNWLTRNDTAWLKTHIEKAIRER